MYLYRSISVSGCCLIILQLSVNLKLRSKHCFVTSSWESSARFDFQLKTKMHTWIEKMTFINKMTKQTSNTKTYMYKMIYKTSSVHCDKKVSVFHAPEIKRWGAKHFPTLKTACTNNTTYEISVLFKFSQQSNIQVWEGGGKLLILPSD